MILMLFHLFCMFDDYWRMDHWSLNSVGKSTVKIQYLRRPENKTNQMEVIILPDHEGGRKGRARGPTPCGGAAPILAARPRGVATLAHLWPSPFAYFFS